MKTDIIRNAELGRLTTFGLAARATELAVLEDPAQLPALLDCNRPVLMLGGGSNTVFLGDFPGRIILNRLRGIDMETVDDRTVRVTVAGGEHWHGLVRWCLDQQLHGMENLAMIPGLVGAAPMQNIGAYGVELADVLEAVQVFDRAQEKSCWLEAAECRLSYRDSRFKTQDRNRFVILAVRLLLSRQFQPVMRYDSLSQALARAGLDQPTPRQIAAAVMRIRRHRLPDPARLANAGSFFKNPVMPATRAAEILALEPDLVNWPQSDGSVKISAAWMIERLGWKGKSLGRVGVYHGHALVLVNHGNAVAAELLRLIEAIRNDVGSRFGLDLEVEPNLIGDPG